MHGQWIGRYRGSNSGMFVINLDDMGTCYRGEAFAYDDDPAYPSICALVQTPGNDSICQGCVDIFPIHPRTGDRSTWDQVIAFYPPNLMFPRRAEVRLYHHDGTLKISWKTDIGTSGVADLPASRANEQTEYKPLPDVSNWEQFKEYVTKLEPRRYIFRGQKELLRLRTGFHRTGRADLARFLRDDIQTLHRHLCGITRHIFDLSVPNENGSFINLAQHHGYPTPLLDWTYSPYVCAFFAYRRVRNSEAVAAGDDKKVRIIAFDHTAWRNTFNQVVTLTPCQPHFSILEFIAIDNGRLIPQQSISSITNVDDIESYIKSKETADRQYMHIIDLPMRERPRIMQELSMMGITSGSLFPGLDGACEEIKERFFSI